MDWTIAGDLQVSDATGYRIAMLPEKTTSYSYTTDSCISGFLLQADRRRHAGTVSDFRKKSVKVRKL
jgi:hypothetical protein